MRNQVTTSGWLLIGPDQRAKSYQLGQAPLFLLFESGNERDDSCLLVLIRTTLLDRRWKVHQLLLLTTICIHYCGYPYKLRDILYLKLSEMLSKAKCQQNLLVLFLSLCVHQEEPKVEMLSKRNSTWYNHMRESKNSHNANSCNLF